MIAFHDIKAEMRNAIPAITAPYSGQAAPPARPVRGPAYEEADTPIEPWMEAAFHGLTHAGESGAPYALVPCTMNGEPAAVIALARPLGGTRVEVMPLFLACQPWMNFSSEPGDRGDEGGPDRHAADPPAGFSPR